MHACDPSMGAVTSCMQDANDPYPAYPEDADVPEGTTLIAFRMEAADKIRELGNGHFKQACLAPLH